nr:hypothetical protein [Maliibacterium massiliense]
MKWLFMGCGAYLLFFLYDIAGVRRRLPLLQGAFALGCLLLAAALAGLGCEGWRAALMPAWQRWTFSALALFFLALLLYTLFFALPFADTYVHQAARSPVCDRGVYALCRHPGVLWQAGLCFSMYLALGTRDMLLAALLFTLLNVLYVLLQDRWTFMRQFDDYGRYRRTTPFLLPTKASLRACARTFARAGRKKRHEV